MERKILIIAIILLTVFLGGCIQTDISNINEMAISINNHINRGDEYYNQSAADTNKLSYIKALSECDNATAEYNLAQTSAQTAFNSAKNSKDNVFIEYMQNVIYEIEAKLNATTELKNAIKYLQTNQTSIANDHLQQANANMDRAVKFKNIRLDIVKQNPSKFK